MSEHHNKRDPLEKLFQKKAEDYDVSYNEADWINLEKRLDILDRQRAYRKRQRWIAAASVLVFSLLAYFTYENHLKINQISQKLNESTVPEAQHEEAVEDPNTELNDRSGSEDNQNGSLAAGDSVKGNQPAPLLSLSEESVHQEAPVNDREAEGAGDSDGVSPSYTLDGSALFVSELSCPTCSLSELMSETKEPPVISDPGTIETKRADPPPLFASADARDDAELYNSRIAIGLVMGPDLSTVGSMSDFYDPGYKAGLTVEYRLGPRISVSTGIIQAEVRYLAQGNEYKPPAGYWTNGIVPYETVGECILLDIPLSIKYDIKQYQRSGLYVTAGLSSYIMLNEDYSFNYDDEDYGLVQSWSGKTRTRHWMSNAGFSIGYELDVHSNWSLRAEPFIKVPLKEVGWGNVKLYSVGSFVSINYKL